MEATLAGPEPYRGAPPQKLPARGVRGFQRIQLRAGESREVTFTLGLRIKSTAPLGAARFAIDATDPVTKAQATALLHIFR